MVILAKPKMENAIKMYYPVGAIDYEKFDCDLNGSKDFEIVIPLGDWTNEIELDDFVYIPSTEFGGQVGKIETNTAEGNIIITGFTLRGLQEAFTQAVVDDYRIIPAGTLHQEALEILSKTYPLQIKVGGSIGSHSKKVQLPRWCNNYEALNYYCEKTGCTWKAVFEENTENGSLIFAYYIEERKDLTEEVNLSSNLDADYTASETSNQASVVYGLGKGELKKQDVCCLYIDSNENIQEYDEWRTTDITSFIQNGAIIKYESTGSSTHDELVEATKQHFDEVKNSKAFEMKLNSIENMDIDIGSIVGGQDYLTGIYMKVPITNKIYTDDGISQKIEYEIDEKTQAIISASGGGGGGSVDWESITGKPSAYPPESHTHTTSSITDISGKSGSLQIGKVLIQWGVFSLSDSTRVGTGTSPYIFSYDIQFTKAFASAPVITYTLRGNYSNVERILAYSSNASHVNTYIHRTSNATTGSVGWIAIGTI